MIDPTSELQNSIKAAKEISPKDLAEFTPEQRAAYERQTARYFGSCMFYPFVYSFFVIYATFFLLIAQQTVSQINTSHGSGSSLGLCYLISYH